MSDGEGHLALKADGSAYPGVCHCAANEAHVGDPADAEAYGRLWAPPPSPSPEGEQQ
jgi:hypothetical protein